VKTESTEALPKNKKHKLSRASDFYLEDELVPQEELLRNPKLIESHIESHAKGIVDGSTGALLVSFSPELSPISDLYNTSKIGFKRKIYPKSEDSANVADKSNTTDKSKDQNSKSLNTNDADLADILDDGQDDSAKECIRQVPARFIGLYGEDFLFSLETNDVELLKWDSFVLIKEEAPSLPLPKECLLKNSSEFLDPALGWLTEVTSTRGANGSFSELPKDNIPELGLSFVSCSRDEIGRVASDLVKALSSNDTVLIISPDLDFLAELGSRLRDTPLADKLFYPHVEALKTFYSFSLLKIMDQNKAIWENEAKTLIEREAQLKKEELSLNADYQIHRSLNSLEKNLRALKDEVKEREKDWIDLEMSYSMALLRWQEADSALRESSPGILNIFSSKKRQEELKLSEEKAKEALEAAERALGNARREKDDFVREARGLREELLMMRAAKEKLPSSESISQKLKDTQKHLSDTALALTNQKHKIRFSHNIQKDRDHTLNFSIFLARPDYRKNSSLPQDALFDNVIYLAPKIWTHKSRKEFLDFSYFAKKRYLALTDLSLIPFKGEAPDKDNLPWRAYLASPHLSLEKIAKFPLLHSLKPSHVFSDDSGYPKILHRAERYPDLIKQNIHRGLALCPLPEPGSLSLRAHSELGPSNPATAIASVKLAHECLKKKTVPEVIILAPSPTQSRLLRSLILDFNLEKERIWAGEIEDFDGFKPKALVIIDSALGPPHTTHPFAKGDTGAKFIIKALSLSSGALVVVGNDELLRKLPKNGPLHNLYKNLSERMYLDSRLGLNDLNFLDALDKAKESIFAVLPPMEPLWWSQLAPRFFASLRRRVKITIISDLPSKDNRDYPGAAIRELRISGAFVILSQGFESFSALVDNNHFTWGYVDNLSGMIAFKGLRSITLEKTAPLISKLFQLPLINKKLSPQSFRSCPSCGWPYLLINQDRTRGFGDLNSIKLGCLNESCPIHKKPRPLDERWPFLSPPLCKEDDDTPYRRLDEGKREYWVCPKHPDGPCPRHLVIPGDSKGEKFN
jgi:hypothetical protein